MAFLMNLHHADPALEAITIEHARIHYPMLRPQSDLHGWGWRAPIRATENRDDMACMLNYVVYWCPVRHKTALALVDKYYNLWLGVGWIESGWYTERAKDHRGELAWGERVERAPFNTDPHHLFQEAYQILYYFNCTTEYAIDLGAEPGDLMIGSKHTQAHHLDHVWTRYGDEPGGYLEARSSMAHVFNEATGGTPDVNKYELSAAAARTRHIANCRTKESRANKRRREETKVQLLEEVRINAPD